MPIKLNLRLAFDDIRDMLGVKYEYPKYVSPLINLANQLAGATKPRIVGQMSELIKECLYKSFEGWKRWYLERYPKSIEDATSKIMNMLKNFKEALEKIDEETVRKWVKDLVLVKTFVGLTVQEPILAFISKKLDESYRLATPEEEAKGIDGFISEYSVSIKPATFKEKIGIAEIRPNGDVVVYYEKKSNEIVISEIDELTD